MKMIFKVFYQKANEKREHMAFVNAGNRYDAQRIAEGLLNKECIVTNVVYGAMHQITPQSLTLNFPNTSEYTLFG